MQKRNQLILCYSCNWSWFVCSNKGKARTCTVTVFAVCSWKNNWTEERLSLAWQYTHDDYAFPLHPRYEQICLNVPGCLVYRLYCRWVDLIFFSMVAIFLNNHSISYSNLVQRDQPSKGAIICNSCSNCKWNHSSWEFNDHSLWTKMGILFYISSCIFIFILCQSLFEKSSGDNRQGWRWILIIRVPHGYIGHFC